MSESDSYVLGAVVAAPILLAAGLVGAGVAVARRLAAELPELPRSAQLEKALADLQLASYNAASARGAATWAVAVETLDRRLRTLNEVERAALVAADDG